MHLKYSKGSRQARQRCSPLDGVEPNSLMNSGSIEWQRGQPMGRSLRNTSLRDESDCRGGTMPWVSSLLRPSSVIQSLLQAGATPSVPANAPTPAFLNASSTERRITAVAGQPTYVGDRPTSSAPPDCDLTKRINPRSTMLKAGISGSSTDTSAAHARDRRRSASAGTGTGTTS